MAVEENQPEIKQHARGDGNKHHPALTEAFYVKASKDHDRNFQSCGGAHQDPGKLIRQSKLRANP